MGKHETKYCPRCSAVFECKTGSIMQCQCSTIRLTSDETVFIQEKYDNCLCIKCLRELQDEYAQFKTAYILKE